MGKRTLGSGEKRFELKAGFNGFRWGLMYTEGDPSAVPPGKTRLVINGRPYGGGIVERPGLTSFHDFAIASTDVSFLGDYQSTRPVKLWVLGDGCPGVSSSVGFYLGMLDQEQSPEFQRVVYYSSATTKMRMGFFDDALHIGTDGSLRQLQFIRQPWGTEAISLSGTSQDTPLKTFSGFNITFLQEFDGKLFIGLDGGTGASKIVTWDGLSFRDDLTTIDPPTCAGLYHKGSAGDALFVGFGSATNALKYRVTGDSPGTWTTKTPGAGTLASKDMAVYKDVLYIATGSTDIWTYDADSDTLAQAHSPTSASSVNAVERFNGYLYFGYETATDGIVGKYDGSTWTDVEKNLQTQLSCNAVRALADFRGVLVAGGTKPLNGGRLYFSPGLTTSGTWVESIPNAANNGDIEFLLVN